MSEFIDYLHEVFARFGPIETRRMFSGHGLFREGVMFGLVVKDALYLKADEEARPGFESRGLAPFTYKRGAREVALSYYLAPPEVLDDPEEAAKWARISLEAALRAGSGRNKRPKKRSAR